MYRHLTATYEKYLNNTNVYQFLKPIWRYRQRNTFSIFLVPVPISGVWNFKCGLRTEKCTGDPTFLEIKFFAINFGSPTINLERRPNLKLYRGGYTLYPNLLHSPAFESFYNLEIYVRSRVEWDHLILTALLLINSSIWVNQLNT